MKGNQIWLTNSSFITNPADKRCYLLMESARWRGFLIVDLESEKRCRRPFLSDPKDQNCTLTIETENHNKVSR